MTKLAGRNPFLHRFDEDQKPVSGIKWKPDHWSRGEYQAANKTAAYIKAINQKSFRVMDQNYEEMKRVLDYYVALVGKLDSNTTDAIISSHCDKANVQQYKEWVAKFYRGVKFQVTAFFKQNMYKLARLLGGIKRFLRIPRPVRKARNGVKILI
ncbi:hypothetical protein PRZ48_015242 [Zasmidium cellare]|uniref:Uncharacterized protein n=1 Tax=Zasmidium cellare TaxID=395010 RepID=A0ABR0DY02_ZASCE|nr:hypothetical protein PRZ48_015242 [Zasmidium cellare]